MNEQLIEYYSAMSNFELSELALLYSSALQEQLTVFASVLFAYLAAAHLVGEKLTKFEVISVSALYSTFEINVILGYYTISNSADGVVQFLTGESRNLRFASIVSILVMALILSLVFMIRARTRKDP